MTLSLEIPAAHRDLPVILRVWALVPLTLALVILGGTVFTLPPGPLCDEGMVLFMEGGCDWGRSNVFFFSKLGLLIGMNIAFCVAWSRRIRSPLGFVPHFLFLAVLTLPFLSDPDCDKYYSHPNGSIGQMTTEAMAFAGLGLGLLHRFAATSRRYLLLPLLFGWNSFHVAVFYTGLLFTHHWTWLHTGWIAAVLIAAARAVA